jgi:hypothetical protein
MTPGLQGISWRLSLLPRAATPAEKGGPADRGRREGDSGAVAVRPDRSRSSAGAFGARPAGSCAEVGGALPKLDLDLSWTTENRSVMDTTRSILANLSPMCPDAQHERVTPTKAPALLPGRGPNHLRRGPLGLPCHPSRAEPVASAGVLVDSASQPPTEKADELPDLLRAALHVHPRGDRD